LISYILTGNSVAFPMDGWVKVAVGLLVKVFRESSTEGVTDLVT
jgi:hypothetical protein